MVTHPLLPSGTERSLALAVIESSSSPMLLLNGESAIVAVSASFIQAFGYASRTLVTRPLSKIGSGEWGVPQLRSLLLATASGAAQVTGYEMDLKREGMATRKLVIDAKKLDYGDIRIPCCLSRSTTSPKRATRLGRKTTSCATKLS